ncbi:R3H domain-containing protein 1-like isoform X1 [Tachysurus ichikawai]
MRMSDTVTVKETSETMRGLETEESGSAPAGDGIGKSESREHVEPNGDENCCDDKSETQGQIPGQSAKRPKSNAKLKLVRSLAICEEPSPPPITSEPPPEHQVNLSQGYGNGTHRHSQARLVHARPPRLCRLPCKQRARCLSLKVWWK